MKKISFLLLALAFAPVAWSASAPPPPEVIPIWNNPAEDKLANYRIPQLLVTRSGTLIACVEARYKSGDGSPTDIVIKRSKDGGRTWSETTWVERISGGENYVLPVLLEDRETKRLFFFCAMRDAGLRDPTTRSYYRTSDDEGVTWSEQHDVSPIIAAADEKIQADIQAGRAPREFAGEKPELFGRKLFFFGPGRAIQMSADHRQFPGRLVVPVFLIKDRVVQPRSARAYGDGVLVSDDHGKTWRMDGVAPLGEHGSSEVSVAELDDGRLVMNSRGAPDKRSDSSSAPRTVSFSSDGGRSWTRPEITEALPRYRETHSGLLRINAGAGGKGSWYLFSCPLSTERKDGTILLSKDNHQTWPTRKLIVPGSFGYSNLDRLPDKTLVMIYETASGKEVNLVRFSLEWLME
ncbi:MAG: sialidase family protein [Verrucomicrobiota bacterium]